MKAINLLCFLMLLVYLFVVPVSASDIVISDAYPVDDGFSYGLQPDVVFSVNVSSGSFNYSIFMGDSWENMTLLYSGNNMSNGTYFFDLFSVVQHGFYCCKISVESSGDFYFFKKEGAFDD